MGSSGKMMQDKIEPGTTYHLYNRGNNHEDIFKEEENCIHFLHLLQKYVLPVAEIYAYCLLKNHFHLLLRVKDVNELPEAYREKPFLAFSHLFNAYTKAINKRYRRTGSLFQEHLKRKRVTDEKYLVQLIAYIHLNPVKHGFVEDFQQYRFSSYQAYLSKRGSKVETEYILSLIDRDTFKDWHQEKRLNTEYLNNFLQDQT